MEVSVVLVMTQGSDMRHSKMSSNCLLIRMSLSIFVMDEGSGMRSSCVMVNHLTFMDCSWMNITMVIIMDWRQDDSSSWDAMMDSGWNNLMMDTLMMSNNWGSKHGMMIVMESVINLMSMVRVVVKSIYCWDQIHVSGWIVLVVLRRNIEDLVLSVLIILCRCDCKNGSSKIESFCHLRILLLKFQFMYLYLKFN